MASMSIGRTAEFEEILLPHASLADRCWLRSRWRHRRSSAHGFPHEAEPNTFSGSDARIVAQTKRCTDASLHALESRPCRSTGQAKRQAHLWTAAQLVGGSASGQPRGESSPARVQNIRRSRPGSNQSHGVRNNDAWRLPGSTPHDRHRLAVSSMALALGVPQLGVGLPEPGRHGSSSEHA